MVIGRAVHYIQTRQSSRPKGHFLSDALISLRDVNLTLPSAAGPVHILKGMSLDIGSGEAVGMVGPSGSGKSTLLMVLAGLEPPTGGDITVAGHDLTKLDEDGLARFRRDNVGIVFQAFHLVPTMTALENVAVPLEFAGKADAFERAAEALAEVGLDHRLSHYPGQLSGGEQQRVALARALIADPKILLADEPTGNLDSCTGRGIMRILRRLNEQGATIVLITHEKEIAGSAKSLIELKDGRIVAGRGRG